MSSPIKWTFFGGRSDLNECFLCIEITVIKERLLEEGTGIKEYGLIAEEVNDIAPEFVFCNKVEDEEGNITDEIEGIHYKKFIPVLINEIKKLKQEIDILKGD